MMKETDLNTDHKYMTGNFSSQIQMEETEKKLATTKSQEDDLWNDIIGEEIPWSKMTTTERVKLVLTNITKVCGVIGFLYFFICSLDLLSSSFRLISGKSTGAVMNNAYVANPVVGLMIGILVTVLVQSSSTSTSIIVSMVASGILNVHEAIPMIMGSNIGTSVTNTIVSLTQVGDKEQFRRAFAGATVHDMFNWLSVIVLLTLEVITGVLEKLTTLIVKSLANSNGLKVELLEAVTEPFTDLVVELDSQVVRCWGMGFMTDKDSMIKRFCSYAIANTTELALTPQTNDLNVTVPAGCAYDATRIGQEHSCHFVFYETSMSDSTIGIILLLVSLTILCSSLICIVKLLNSVLRGSIARVIQKVINSDLPYVPWLTGYVAILVGAVLTFVVQSSSVFTSTLTPLIGIGMISVERAYPLTLGSNLGTTTTALLAAMASMGDKQDSIQIALVHSLFNIFGIMIFYPMPFMRWPIPMCKGLGNLTAKYRWFAIFYLIAMFFVLPGSIFALSLGGKFVLWGILGPILIILSIVIIINVFQRKAPHILPLSLQSWMWVPKPLRSLGPYDKVFTTLPCCAKCRDLPLDEEDDVQVVVTPADMKCKKGLDNPAMVCDS